MDKMLFAINKFRKSWFVSKYLVDVCNYIVIKLD